MNRFLVTAILLASCSAPPAESSNNSTSPDAATELDATSETDAEPTETEWDRCPGELEFPLSAEPVRTFPFAGARGSQHVFVLALVNSEVTLLRSQFGIDWEELDPGSVEFSPIVASGENVVIPLESDDLLVSHDSGANFTKVQTEPDWVSGTYVSLMDGSFLRWRVSGSAEYSSDGRDWEEFSLPTTGTIDHLSVSEQGNIAFTQAQTAHYSTDGGATWSSEELPAAPHSYFVGGSPDETVHLFVENLDRGIVWERSGDAAWERARDIGRNLSSVQFTEVWGQIFALPQTNPLRRRVARGDWVEIPVTNPVLGFGEEDDILFVGRNAQSLQVFSSIDGSLRSSWRDRQTPSPFILGSGVTEDRISVLWGSRIDDSERVQFTVFNDVCTPQTQFNLPVGGISNAGLRSAGSINLAWIQYVDEDFEVQELQFRVTGGEIEPISLPFQRLYDLIETDGEYLAIGRFGDGVAASFSEAGLEWQPPVALTKTPETVAAEGADRVTITPFDIVRWDATWVARFNRLYQSDDLINWSGYPMPAPEAKIVSMVTFDDALFVIYEAGEGPELARRTGDQWELLELAVDTQMFELIQAGETLYGLGQDSIAFGAEFNRTVLLRLDGDRWTELLDTDEPYRFEHVGDGILRYVDENRLIPVENL